MFFEYIVSNTFYNLYQCKCNMALYVGVCIRRHTVVCHATRENGACTHDVSILTWRTLYNFMSIHSSMISGLNNINFTVQAQAYQWRLCNRFEVNCGNHSWDMSLKKLLIFFNFFFLFFSFFTLAIKHKCVIRLPSDLALIERDTV